MGVMMLMIWMAMMTKIRVIRDTPLPGEGLPYYDWSTELRRSSWV